MAMINTNTTDPFCRSQRPDARLSSTCQVFSNCGWEDAMHAAPKCDVVSAWRYDVQGFGNGAVPLVPHSRKKVKPIKWFNWPLSVTFSRRLSIKTLPWRSYPDEGKRKQHQTCQKAGRLSGTHQRTRASCASGRHEQVTITRVKRMSGGSLRGSRQME